MGFETEVKNIGSVWVSDLFVDIVKPDSKFLEIRGKAVQSLDKIQREIAAGKKIILSEVKTGDAEKLYRYIEKRCEEAVSFDKKQKILDKSYDRDRKKSFVSAEIQVKSALFVIADLDKIISFTTDVAQTPFLFGLCGNDYPVSDLESNKHCLHLVPYKFYLDLLVRYSERQEVGVLKKILFTGQNVLIPKSPETYQLFYSSIEQINEKLPTSPNILDLGCGSGVLTLIFAQILTNCSIFLTDILPEAIAVARLNIEEALAVEFRVTDRCWQTQKDGNSINLLPSGHLFNKVNDKFDVISFNAPWVPGKPRNRSELALHDDDQKITREFLIDASRYLNHNGCVLLGYSDNGGEEYLAELEQFIQSSGWQIVNTLAKKVQSYQSGRKWQKILVYTLKQS